MSGATATTRFHVTGMDCGACARKVDTAVRRVAGVGEVDVSFATEALVITHDGSLDEADVSRRVEALGFGLRRGSDAAAGTAPPPWWRTGKAAMLAACAGALLIARIVAVFAPGLDGMAFVIALSIGLMPIARRAFAAARLGTPFSIEALMSVAALGAVALGATGEAAAVVVLFLVGEMLEGVAAARARGAISALTGLVPSTAQVEDGGQVRDVPSGDLRPGMVVVVRPGDRVACDGVVVEGRSDVDESPLTGESALRGKAAGDTVHAGTVNATGMLRVRVTAAAADNTLARVVRLVEEAQDGKAPTERFIARFSRLYTPCVVALAAAVACLPPLAFAGSWSEWSYRGLALLLIGCPCALVISTPAAISAALSSGARRGLLVKGGAALERLRDVTVVAFDKTGTLTLGRPTVVAVVAAAGRERRCVLATAAALERGASHPLAHAILEAAKAEGVKAPPAFMVGAVPGEGVSGHVDGGTVFLGSPRAAAARAAIDAALQAGIDGFVEAGTTVAVLVRDGGALGFLAVADEVRADAERGVRRLEAGGIRTLVLTGDDPRAAASVARRLGMEVRAGLMPQGKLDAVRGLQARGEVVAKIGDGINDAPALAAADVGIAMGGGTDMALETADAAVLGGRVGGVADLVALSRATMGNIRLNVCLALGLKAVFLVTTVIGVTGLWPAVLSDTGATVLVTANAMRLLRWRPDA